MTEEKLELEDSIKRGILTSAGIEVPEDTSTIDVEFSDTGSMRFVCKNTDDKKVLQYTLKSSTLEKEATEAGILSTDFIEYNKKSSKESYVFLVVMVVFGIIMIFSMLLVPFIK